MSERVFCHVESVWLSGAECVFDPNQGWMHLVGGFKHSVISSGSQPWTGTAEVMVKADDGGGAQTWGGFPEAAAEVDRHDVGDADDES